MSRNGTPALVSKTVPNGGLSYRDPTRHSPPPLAPLQYLQNQRRGSITDPSLHAAPNTKAIHREPPSSILGLSSKLNPSKSRPSSPYFFEEPISHHDNSPQIRNLLRSPSLERPPRPPPPLLHPPIDAGSGSKGSHGADYGKMDVDLPQASSSARRYARDSQAFDFSMRRHSIAAGPAFQSASGTKRKMSGDRSIFPPLGEESDAQLVGPGVPSVPEVENEGPIPKRRGSAIDTHRIAQLSLNDRRNSVDSRGGPWWLNERRNSPSSVLLSAAPYNAAFSGADPTPHPRLPTGMANFSWPANPPPERSDPSPIPTDTDSSPKLPSRQFDPAPMTMIPPLNFVSDRRTSVPETQSSGPLRNLRSRSRPPSRLTYTAEVAAMSGQEEVSSSPSPSAMSKKELNLNSTPYSRSPELRISHKLAERKRRKEMKDLFDELRDQLPADRGMKASKWEILSKAIDFVAQLKQSNQDMAREIDIMRHELDTTRQPHYVHGGLHHGNIYGQVPSKFVPTSSVAISHPFSSASRRDPSPTSHSSPGPRYVHLSQNGSGIRPESPSAVPSS